MARGRSARRGRHKDDEGGRVKGPPARLRPVDSFSFFPLVVQATPLLLFGANLRAIASRAGRLLPSFMLGSLGTALVRVRVMGLGSGLGFGFGLG